MQNSLPIYAHKCITPSNKKMLPQYINLINMLNGKYQHHILLNFFSYCHSHLHKRSYGKPVFWYPRPVSTLQVDSFNFLNALNVPRQYVADIMSHLDIACANGKPSFVSELILFEISWTDALSFFVMSVSTEWKS